MWRFVGGALLSLLSLPANPAMAQRSQIRDPEVLRADLRSVTIRRQEEKVAGGAMVEVAREQLIYDAAGHLTQHENRRPTGQMVVRMEYAYDKSGRLIETRYRDHTGRIELRRYTYKLDDKGRISERDLRNPAAPAGEFHRDIYTWDDNGGRTVRTYRHYAKEGPYPDGSTSFDAKGRMSRSCTVQHCSMYEYDAHGEVSRIREQNREMHHYRVHENQYDDGGRLIHQRIGGTETDYRHNTRGDIAEARERMSGSPAARLIYEYSYR